MGIKVIAAMSDRSRVIGSAGRIPWHCSEDLKRFKRLTNGCSVIMGRKTHESLDGNLVNRANIVISKSVKRIPNTVVFSDLVEAIAQHPEAWIIGGGKLYCSAFSLDCVEKIELSVIGGNHTGDTFFPSIPNNFNLAKVEQGDGVRFETWQRKRPSWDAYFSQMAKLVASRSTCLGQQVGAVLVRDNQIIATGYNGTPSGQIHCTDLGHCVEVVDQPTCMNSITPSPAVHAEMNAIAQCAKYGYTARGATLYCTHAPCQNCRKLIKSVGIEKIIYE